MSRTALDSLFTTLAHHGADRVHRDCPLAPWVAYRVGGPADVLLETSQETAIVAALEQARHLKLPVTLLGNGTNLLVRDGGIRGLVIYMGQRSHGLDDGIQVREETTEFVRLHVPAHCAKARLLEYALEQSYAGLEFSAGIPGSLGGAVYMNAGTKWGSYAEVIETVRLYSPAKGIFEKSVAEMGFTYRGHGEGVLDGETVVLSVTLKLRKNKTPAQIRALVDEILTYRGGKQPLELPNCGSVFKNPANSELGAGRLIEACGLKGHRVGAAQVSLKHANFILNLGHARSADIEALIREIQRTVLDVKGIALETEVIMLGEAANSAEEAGS